MELQVDKKLLKPPKSIWFIVCQELCERFNYYGLRTILVLYLTRVLDYSDDESTMIYHSFIFLSYFMPLFGAVLSDSYWGKYKTMIRLSIVYAIGNIILTGASMASVLTLDSQRRIAIIGLVLISMGTGGIKPCAYTFGGDQFQLPEQNEQLAKFSYRFLIAIYIGALIATFSTPELRKDVECFGRDSCFPLAFGVLSLLMTTAIVVFLLGRKMYVKRKPENHVIFKTFGCIYYAAYKKLRSSTSEKDHWIDHASDKYSEIEISDTKSALEVVCIFITYPVFWALYEQQGSRWTLQATLMNGRIKGIDWEIKPDQMQTIHPFFALLLVVSFKSVLYPFLAKFGIRRPLQKIIFSNFMAVIAFLLAALLHYRIFGESTVIPPNKGQFTVYNGFDCNVHVNTSSQIDGNLRPLNSTNFMYTPMSNEDIVNVSLTFDLSCSSYMNLDKLKTNVTVSKEKSISYILSPTVNQEAILRRIHHYDDFTKPKNGHPSLRIIIGDDVNKDESFAIIGKLSLNRYNVSSFANEDFKQVDFGNYYLTQGEKVITSNIILLPATIYTLMIRNNSHKMESKLYATDNGKYIHILWQTPQYICMILADVIFIATTIEFSFTEAPLRIKSFISACYFLTQSFGNLIIVVTLMLSFHKQVHEYLFYSGIMLVDMLLLIYLSYNYKYKSFVQRISDNYDDKNDIQIEN